MLLQVGGTAESWARSRSSYLGQLTAHVTAKSINAYLSCLNSCSIPQVDLTLSPDRLPQR